MQGKDETSPAQFTYVIQGLDGGLRHVTNILAMLVDISIESASSYDATAAFQDYLAWIFESFLMVHELQNKWQVDPTFHEMCKKSEVLSFCAMHALLTSIQGQIYAAMLRKGYTILSILCADLLKSPANLTDSLIRLKVCRSILNLVVICKEHDSMRKSTSLHVVPSIQNILNDSDTRSTLGKDFKV